MNRSIYHKSRLDTQSSKQPPSKVQKENPRGVLFEIFPCKLKIVDIKKWQMTTTFFSFIFFFLSKVFTLVSSAISHLKEDKISFAEKNILPSKLHVF